MRAHDPLLYLIGDRDAALRIARARHAPLVGFVLVLSGSLARNYDGAYLLEEWDVLLHGVGVSTANATIIYTLTYAAAAIGKVRRPAYLKGWWAFLGLFWMTAPMAWLYGVPYERLTDPANAVLYNAITLAVVSVWRVALIAVALHAVWGARIWATMGIVALFSDAALFAASQLAPTPIIDFMGGFRHTPAEQALMSIRFNVVVFSVLLSPVFFIWGCAGSFKFRGGWCADGDASRVSPGAWVAAAAAAAMWMGAPGFTQAEQKRRFEAERLLTAGDVASGLAYLSARPRADFPPAWDPPPRLGYGENLPSVEALRAELARGGQAAWVREVYLAKSERRMRMLLLGLLPRSYVEEYEGAARTPPLYENERVEQWEIVSGIRFHIEHDERLDDQARSDLRHTLRDAGYEDDPPDGR